MTVDTSDPNKPRIYFTKGQEIWAMDLEGCQCWKITMVPAILGNVLMHAYIFSSSFKNRFQVSQGGQKCTRQPRMPLNFCSSFFYLLNAWISDVCHQVQFYEVLAIKPSGVCQAVSAELYPSMCILIYYSSPSHPLERTFKGRGDGTVSKELAVEKQGPEFESLVPT